MFPSPLINTYTKQLGTGHIKELFYVLIGFSCRVFFRCEKNMRGLQLSKVKRRGILFTKLAHNYFMSSISQLVNAKTNGAGGEKSLESKIKQALG